MLHPVETTLRHLIMKCFYMENTHTHFSCWAPKVFHLNYFWRRLNSHFNAQRLFCKMPIDVLQFCETNTQIIFTGSGDFLINWPQRYLRRHCRQHCIQIRAPTDQIRLKISISFQLTFLPLTYVHRV